MENLKVKVSEGFTDKELKELKEWAFNQFKKKARYQGGEYLIECKGKILIAKTPAILFEKYIECNRINH